MKEKVENSGITTFDSNAQFSEVMGFHTRKLGGLQVDLDWIPGLLTKSANCQKQWSLNKIVTRKIVIQRSSGAMVENTELMHEKLEGFITTLNLKIVLNTDCYPTEVSQIAYVFSHTSDTTQAYVSAKISANQYSNWNQVVQDLCNTFADPDPKFHAQKKLLNIRQTNWPFAAFFTKNSHLRNGSDDKARVSVSTVAMQVTSQPSAQLSQCLLLPCQLPAIPSTWKMSSP